MGMFHKHGCASTAVCGILFYWGFCLLPVLTGVALLDYHVTAT